MTVEQLLTELEDTALLLQKARTNLSKCPKQRLTKGYIETRLQSIDDYWKKFTTAHYNLLKCIPKEKKHEVPYIVNEDYFQIEELYLSLQGDLKDLLSTKLSSKSRENSLTRINNSNATSEGHVKLPTIQLPTFSGIYENWPAFQDLFTSLVHDNSSLSKVQKLHYLKSTITGEAEFLLKHIQVTENNYEQAWELLKSRYGNKRLIVNSLLKKLCMQRKIPSQTANNIKSLLDNTSECINSLKNLNINTDSWDPLIIFLVVQKLDPDSHRDWEEHSYKDNLEDLPTWSDLVKFLQAKFRTLELVAPPLREKQYKSKDYAVHTSTEPIIVKQRICALCNGNHTLCHCTEFIKMDPVRRSEYVRQNNLCYNCLGTGHSARKCRLTMSCRVCRKRHHTLVHLSTLTDSPSYQANKNQPKGQEQGHQAEENIELSSHVVTNSSTALLATALVPIRNDKGHVTMLRALIDQGSQATFISEPAAQLLNLKRSSVSGTITGIGSTKTHVRKATEIELLSRHDMTFYQKIKAYIIPTQLTKQLPSRTIYAQDWSHLQGLNLADPDYNKSLRIDLLLGVEVYANIMKNEVIKGPPGTPCAQNTSLGWILFGKITYDTDKEELRVLHLNLELDNMLKRMWELDKHEAMTLSKEEKKCEEIYQVTHSRNEEGRYVVKLPMKTEEPQSTQGETRAIALNKFYQLEKRLNKNPALKEKYTSVMEEYIQMNHMEEVKREDLHKPSYYMPHHAVVKEDKETTKLRIVFNASQKGNNNISLNEELLVGPQLQGDMRSLIMKWRMKRVCYVADVQKMYRQILVKEEDKDLQRILWRKNTDEPVKDYRLTRVTFGTASAPYLAIKTLQQIACDEAADDPETARVIKEDFYVDDVMSGNDDVTTAITTAKKVDQVLKRGGFVLQKWCSNNIDVLKGFKSNQRSSQVNVDITIDGTIRALGLQWDMGKDILEYNLHLPHMSEIITKRIILADIQRLFDPLGWLVPAILPLKLLIQKLWLKGLPWDEEVDENFAKEWINLRTSLENLNGIKINRWLHTKNNNMDKVTIHGFCDASTKAYAAVAYIRVDDGENIYTRIIAAKCRVAPVKPTTLPRLELCGALLLSRLLKHIRQSMNVLDHQIFAWTDSTIVLSWLQGDPARWNIFVRNRVVEILDNIGHKWYHVQTNDNPADVASRGETALELQNDSKWWTGPKWLQDKFINYPNIKNLQTNIESKELLHVNLNIQLESLAKKFENFIDLSELTKTIIYCKRFLNSKKIEKIDMPISTEEVDQALKSCIRIVQRDSFAEEIELLKKNKNVKLESKLKTLNPFLDKENILRVGGRLRHAEIDYDKKYPIILCNSNLLTNLVIADAHEKTLHGNVQLMLCYLRTRFWILKAKSLTKAYANKCLTCAKQRAVARTQLMGDLPKCRVTPSRAFHNSGVDFAGPFNILTTTGRGSKTKKAYVSIFVCMATKAVHLELVGNLTSESFIGAFKRFIARRGRCAHLWSDQGRNFVGANRELAQAFKEAKLEFEGTISESLALDGTQWHFIPSYSPHMGGLWEAGVKSLKYHMKRMITRNLTFEEMITLLSEIEACLNSRPLTPIDTADIDQTPITPGHFLIGEAPIVVPQSNVSSLPISYMTRWQHMQKLLSDLWFKWQQEYLSNLQQRCKWFSTQKELQIGQIVLMKDEKLPPGKWQMGRIIDKHPGTDGITRVYSVKTGGQIVQRAVAKLCPLPINTD